MTPTQMDSKLVHIGREHNVKLPDSRTVTIRETNGEDDDILSRVSDSLEGNNIVNFLANIVIKDLSTGLKPTTEDILRWPVNNKYFLLFQQRILNHGNALLYKETCQVPSCEKGQAGFDLEQDLGEYSMKPYPYKDQVLIEFKTSSGKMLRYKILDSILERKQLDIPQESVSKNTQLIIRELELFNKNEWQLVTTFHAFSSKEMTEIRKHVREADETFEPLVKYTCPFCKTHQAKSLMAIPAFYFPEEI